MRNVTSYFLVNVLYSKHITLNIGVGSWCDLGTIALAWCELHVGLNPYGP
jgi:hypothetical protein